MSRILSVELLREGQLSLRCLELDYDQDKTSDTIDLVGLIQDAIMDVSVHIQVYVSKERPTCEVGWRDLPLMARNVVAKDVLERMNEKYVTINVTRRSGTPYRDVDERFLTRVH